MGTLLHAAARVSSNETVHSRLETIVASLIPFCGATFHTVAAGSSHAPPTSLAGSWLAAFTAAEATQPRHVQDAIGNKATEVLPSCAAVLANGSGVTELSAVEAEAASSRGAPALYRNAVLQDNASLTPDLIMQIYAADDVRVAGIPYADVFGGEAGWASLHEFATYMNATFAPGEQTGTTWRTLAAEASSAATCDAAAASCSLASSAAVVVQRLCRAYVNLDDTTCEGGAGGANCGPLYVFDTAFAQRRLLDSAVRWPPALAAAYGSTEPVFQFGLGPVCAGAPFHHHEDAWNVLFAGAKLWWLRAPGARVYGSVPPARELLKGQGDNSWTEGPGASGTDPDILCVQLPGDLLYVPRGWAHRTLNLERGAGLAAEYNQEPVAPWTA